MVKKVKAVSPWHNGTTPLEELSPNDQLAHQMVSDYIELMPSVTRIMDAPMTDDERHTALTAFRDSLGKVGDPNRDPRVAIANAVGTATTSS